MPNRRTVSVPLSMAGYDAFTSNWSSWQPCDRLLFILQVFYFHWGSYGVKG